MLVRNLWHLGALLIAGAGFIAILLMRIWCAPQHVPNAAPVSAKAVIRNDIKATTSPPETPAVAPVQYLPLTPSEAVTLNAKQKPTGEVGPPAAPFRTPDSDLDSARALKCLTDAVYYEAASQDVDGQRAVAQVVLNRVRNPAFPATVCGVVYQGADRVTGCQFTFTCDGSLTRVVWQRAWLRAQVIAKAALNGFVFKPVGYSTHYHADWVVPYWASSLTRATSVGAHIFYRWKGSWGEPRAFAQRYAGGEPEPWLTGPPPQVADSNIESSFGLNPTVAGLPPTLPRPGNSKAHLTLNADRALGGSTLRVDERPPRLIPSLTIKPEIVADLRSDSSQVHRPQLKPRQVRSALRD